MFMNSPDSNVIKIRSDAQADRVIFVQSLPDGSKMKFHVVATIAGEPLAFGYSHEAAAC
jgi:hypothetical protein